MYKCQIDHKLPLFVLQNFQISTVMTIINPLDIIGQVKHIRREHENHVHLLIESNVSLKDNRYFWVRQLSHNRVKVYLCFPFRLPEAINKSN
jgi:hypothetical protein